MSATQTEFEKALFSEYSEEQIEEKVKNLKMYRQNAIVLAVLIDDADANPDKSVQFWLFEYKDTPVSKLLMLGRKSLANLESTKSLTCIIQHRDDTGKVHNFMPNGTMTLGDLNEAYVNDLGVLNVIFMLENTFG